MTQAKLLRNKNGQFDLVIDGNVYGNDTYNHYSFTATGRKADGSRFDTAQDLGITKISHDEYHVADANKFLAWAAIPGAKPVRIIGVEDGAL